MNIAFFNRKKVGSDLLSHPQKGSTIGAEELNFSVRNGKRWVLLAIATNCSSHKAERPHAYAFLHSAQTLNTKH